MPYGKSYRYRKAYRKYYNRSKTLRKSNIFTNRSAKSQSFQIAALNRKVNRVYRKTKPEYKIVGVTGAHSDFMDSSQVGNTNRQYYQDGPRKQWIRRITNIVIEDNDDEIDIDAL